ncbi:MAG TPA: YceI family protein [Candidatus Acidoferrales bacterium]|nr:YceI family protein [Candidatus Acidoferrales bacterium]
MNGKRNVTKRATKLPFLIGLALAGTLLAGGAPSIVAQASALSASAASPGARLDVADGTTASYRVQEQLAGINFPNEAVGTTSSVMGTIVLAPDGSVNSAQSKLTIDLRTLKSDQEMRDGYLQKRTLETDKFPMVEFVPKSIQGLPSPLPMHGQAGVTLVGDMTIHGTTRPVTWTGIVTFAKDGTVAGRATTNFTFATFGLTKPSLARVLSVGDKIELEVAFKFKRS